MAKRKEEEVVQLVDGKSQPKVSITKKVCTLFIGAQACQTFSDRLISIRRRAGYGRSIIRSQSTRLFSLRERA